MTEIAGPSSKFCNDWARDAFTWAKAAARQAKDPTAGPDHWWSECALFYLKAALRWKARAEREV